MVDDRQRFGTGRRVDRLAVVAGAAAAAARAHRGYASSGGRRLRHPYRARRHRRTGPAGTRLQSACAGAGTQRTRASRIHGRHLARAAHAACGAARRTGSPARRYPPDDARFGYLAAPGSATTRQTGRGSVRPVAHRRGRARLPPRADRSGTGAGERHRRYAHAIRRRRPGAGVSDPRGSAAPECGRTPTAAVVRQRAGEHAAIYRRRRPGPGALRPRRRLLAAGVRRQRAGRGTGQADAPVRAFLPHRSLASRSSGGSGLGLAICRNIVEAHDGTIAAAASPLGGLRITLRLPVLEA